MTTAYYWFLSVDPDRPGGGWWHRQFDCPVSAKAFVDDLQRFLHAWALDDSKHICNIDCKNLPPPKDAKIEYEPEHITEQDGRD